LEKIRRYSCSFNRLPISAVNHGSQVTGDFVHLMSLAFLNCFFYKWLTSGNSFEYKQLCCKCDTSSEFHLNMTACLGVIMNITHSHKSARGARKGKIWPPPPLNPLTDRHHNLHRWLHQGYLPSRKILSKSDHWISTTFSSQTICKECTSTVKEKSINEIRSIHCTWMNALSHTWHLHGFSPLSTLLCTARFNVVVNCSLQTVHSNGFSPEWLHLCFYAQPLMSWMW